MGKPVPYEIRTRVRIYRVWDLVAAHQDPKTLRGDLPGTPWLFASLLLPMQTHVGSRVSTTDCGKLRTGV